MFRSLTGPTFAALVLMSAATLSAQEKSLSRVPSKAPIVASIKGYDLAPAEVAKMLANAVPDLAPKYTKEFTDALNQLTEGRDTKEIRKNAPWYIAVTDLASLLETPKITVLLPITGYKAFKESFLTKDELKAITADGKVETTSLKGEMDVFLVDSGEYAILSNSKDDLAMFQKVDESIEKLMSDDSKALFAKSTVSIYVNLKTINDAYGPQLKGFKTLIDIALQGGQGGLDKKQAEMAKSVLTTFFQILDDGENLIVGAEFRPEGLNIALSTQFGDRTGTGKFLASQKPTALADVAKLPAGKMNYTGLSFDPKSSKILSSLVAGLAGTDEDEAVQKKIDEAEAALVAAGVISSTGASDMKGGSVSIATYKDNEAAAAATLKLTGALTANSTMASLAFKSKPVVKASVAKIGGFDLNSVAVEYDFDKIVAALPEEARAAQKAMLEKVSGGPKQTIWFGTDGKAVITVTATDADTAKALLEAYTSGKSVLDGDKAYAATRKNLPAQTSYLTLLETGRIVEMMGDTLKSIGNIQPGALPIQIPELKAPKGETSYIGIALTLKPKHGTIDVFVPAAAVGTIRRMVGPSIDD